MSPPHAPHALNLRDAWDRRWPERQLLALCTLAITLGFLMTLGESPTGEQAPSAGELLPALLYALSLAAIHLTLVACRFRGDQMLVGAAAFLFGFGLLAQHRLGATDAGGGLGGYAFPLGIAVLLITLVGFMRGRYQRLAAVPWLWAGLSLGLLAVLLILGQRFRGGVYAPGLITPTELLKLTLVVFLAGYIHRHQQALGTWTGPVPLPPLGPLWPLAAFWLVLGGLLLLQRDIGMFLILSLTLVVLLAAGTGRIGYLVYGVVAAGGLGYLVLYLFAHGQRRLQAWQDPFADPTGASWQILQGLSGMYSGGLWGQGFGQGNPEYTPIAESDFIYAVIGEELGFLGCTLVVILFLILFARGLSIAWRSRSSFGFLLGVGLTSVIATQTFLNLGGVTAFIPLTGLTLPLISHGGSSLLTAFAMLGLILAISEDHPAAAQPGPTPPAAPRPRKGPARSAPPKGSAPRPTRRRPRPAGAGPTGGPPPAAR